MNVLWSLLNPGEMTMHNRDRSEPVAPHRAERADVDTLGSTQALIDHILRVHHTYTRDAITTLQPLMQKVLRVHGTDHPELVSVARAFDRLSVDLEPHLLKEETILFPALCAMERNDEPLLPFPLSHPIERMRAEHEGVVALLHELATLTGNYNPPDDACTSWHALLCGLADLDRDLHLHMHLENNVLFRRHALPHMENT